MADFVPWDSQPLETWAEQHADGQFIALDGHQTHHVVRGEGDPVILVHGFNLDLNTWAANIDALAPRFTVYSVDFLAGDSGS